MDRKYFTFLFIPHTNQKIRNLKLPPWLAWSLIVILPALILSPLLFWGIFIRHSLEIRTLRSLEREKQVLTEKIGSFEEEIDDLHRELESLTDFDNTIRLIADLDQVDDDIRKMGHGGTALPVNDPDCSVFNPIVRMQLQNLRTDIDRLKREILFQKDSFRDVINSLETKKEILRYTPSLAPVAGWLTDGYGMRTDPFTGIPAFHHGIDIAAQRLTEIVAPADGVVTFAGWNGNFGKTVKIHHKSGYGTVYAHNYRNLVKKGDRIKRGDVIALVGNTGRSTGPHLHYEVHCNGKTVNPLDYIINREILR
jgi:hypothetical protein